MTTKKARDDKSLNEVIAHDIVQMFGEAVRRAKHQLDNGQVSKRMQKTGSYPFIPSSEMTTCRLFVLLGDKLRQTYNEHGNDPKHWCYGKDRWNRKFLDAGCGIGNIMLLARRLALASTCDGIEYDKKTIEAANRFPGMFVGGMKIHHDDILTFNKYNEYDIIYYYCPFSNGLLESFFEERLEDQVDVGTVIIPALKQSESMKKDYRFKRLFLGRRLRQPVYVKVKGGERRESDLLRRWKGADIIYRKRMPVKYKQLITKHIKEMEAKGVNKCTI